MTRAGFRRLNRKGATGTFNKEFDPLGRVLAALRGKGMNMGQMADDIVEGTTCTLCGMFFENTETDEIYTHGYPVVCWDCWKHLSKRDRKEYQRALMPTLG